MAINFGQSRVDKLVETILPKIRSDLAKLYPRRFKITWMRVAGSSNIIFQAVQSADQPHPESPYPIVAGQTFQCTMSEYDLQLHINGAGDAEGDDEQLAETIIEDLIEAIDRPPGIEEVETVDIDDEERERRRKYEERRALEIEAAKRKAVEEAEVARRRAEEEAALAAELASAAADVEQLINQETQEWGQF